jgi:hypothetical protein
LKKTKRNQGHGATVFRAAKLLIDRHGADAGLRAAERAVEHKSDMEGAGLWRRILKAIEELGRGRQPDERLN